MTLSLFSIDTGQRPCKLLELVIEMGKTVEPYLISYLRYTQIGVLQQRTSLFYS